MAKNEYICDCNTVNRHLVEKVRADMPEEEVFTALSDFYKIIADNTRCRILYILSCEEMCVCDIANVLSMTKSSVSHQLKKMRSAAIVKCRKEGKSVYYSLDDEHISQVFGAGFDHIGHKNREVLL